MGYKSYIRQHHSRKKEVRLMKKRGYGLILVLIIVFSATSYVFASPDEHPLLVAPTDLPYIENPIAK